MTFKGRQLKSREDRTALYRDWRHEFGGRKYVTDVDQVEYRVIDGVVIPVAVIELTRANGNLHNSQALREAVLRRINEKSMQGDALRKIADALGVNAYIALLAEDLSEIYRYNLTEGGGWYIFTQSEYKRWIESL